MVEVLRRSAIFKFEEVIEESFEKQKVSANIEGSWTLCSPKEVRTARPFEPWLFPSER